MAVIRDWIDPDSGKLKYIRGFLAHHPQFIHGYVTLIRFII
ncbi:hypothetical protein ASAP_1441 [Asaia bogorensis]|uniref:Uncharacterized protein n=1 Tax=Asaia bogorensis TaxID=91915 RepID=A0A060QJP9_9PROT|nr:hypothetical protein ASAP_1441 [Asaia bogorensis]